MKDIAVIGGGAAGMMAAIIAKREGNNVLLIERNDRLGKKLLATGNGRCNYTNIYTNIKNYHGQNDKFAISGLSQFNVDNTLEFFEELGITPVVDEGGKVFPHSYQSSSMLDILKMELKKLKVDIALETFVKKIIKEDGNFKIITNKESFVVEKVIVTTGGMALPDSGSDGNGYNLVKEFGHNTTEIFPALVQLKLDGKVFKPISGVKFLGEASLYIDDIFIKSDRGDILFTDYGISGPPILQLSRSANEGVNNGKNVELRVKLIMDKDNIEILSYLYYRFGFMGEKTISDGLIGLINTKLIDPIVRESKINKNKKIAELKTEEIERLGNTLIDWRFKVIGSQIFKFAQVTAGGIDTKDIDNQSLESKIVKGLFFAGEILDIDGDCGGFNLQWAWSSAYIAAKNASI